MHEAKIKREMEKHLARNHETQSLKSSTIREKQREREREREKEKERYIDIDKVIGRKKK
jgi:hypothetical protein